MNSNAPLMQEGDEIILFFGYNQNMRPLTLKRGETFSTREGFWPHANFINKPFGSRVVGRHRNNSDAGSAPPPFLTALRNTPEHWSNALPHRTQIIVQTDISVICAKLELRPGKVVAEAGTGSGSLTHSLARAVAPNGKVFTFDFHKQRAETARAEFKAHGIDDVVVSNWRDVCSVPPAPPGEGGENTNSNTFPQQSEQQQQSAEGGGDADDEKPQPGYGLPDHSVDAVFLDVPCPWEAVPNVLRVLREGTGAVCSYSPCIEQTQRFCEALRRSECFFDIHTVEALAREHVPIFTQRNERRRLRDTGLLPSSTAEEDGSGEASNSAKDPNALPSSIRGYCPQNTGRGHTAFLTFAKRKRQVLEVKQGEEEAQ